MPEALCTSYLLCYFHPHLQFVVMVFLCPKALLSVLCSISVHQWEGGGGWQWGSGWPEVLKILSITVMTTWLVPTRKTLALKLRVLLKIDQENDFTPKLLEPIIVIPSSLLITFIIKSFTDYFEK